MTNTMHYLLIYLTGSRLFIFHSLLISTYYFSWSPILLGTQSTNKKRFNFSFKYVRSSSTKFVLYKAIFPRLLISTYWFSKSDTFIDNQSDTLYLYQFVVTKGSTSRIKLCALPLKETLDRFYSYYSGPIFPYIWPSKTR